MKPTGGEGAAGRTGVGLLLLALGIAWAAFVHHGLGPRPDLAVHWYSPRGFVDRALAGGPFAWMLADRLTVLLVFGTPALLLAIGCWLATRSALIRALSVIAALATGIFVAYARGSAAAEIIWNLFHWRASATMLALSAVVGAALTAPWLAARWLQLRWPARLAWILPVSIAVIAIERNVTGTDPRLPFAISPWPVVQVFGLETVGTIVASLLGGLGLGLLGLDWLRSGRSVAGALLVALGLALPAGWLALGAQGLLPFRPGPRAMGLAAAACALGLVLAAAPRFEPARLARRARVAGAAALLLGIPLLAGQAWARWDYARNRGVYARQVIDALAAYYDREAIYPDDLDALVEAGHLEAVPRPQIGFAALDGRSRFAYQAFGTSYLLEFPAPRWVQCAYNPPYGDEGELEDDPSVGAGDAPAGDAADAEALAGAWSCPQSPPELW